MSASEQQNTVDSTEPERAGKAVWYPLESDPDVMSDYLRVLTLTDHYLIDVPVIDEAEELGIFTGHNVKAFIFLYEINERTESERTEAVNSPSAGQLVHIKQLISNACGSVALFHAYLNKVEPSRMEPSSVMYKFWQQVKDKSFEEKGEAFATNEDIATSHAQSAVLGQSSIPSEDKLRDINYHFVTILWHNNAIFKLDGRCAKPVQLSPLDKVVPEGDFKREALEVIKKLIQRDPDNLNFSIIAFCGE